MSAILLNIEYPLEFTSQAVTFATDRITAGGHSSDLAAIYAAVVAQSHPWQQETSRFLAVTSVGVNNMTAGNAVALMAEVNNEWAVATTDGAKQLLIAIQLSMPGVV